jgi:hypothetical protein
MKSQLIFLEWKNPKLSYHCFYKNNLECISIAELGDGLVVSFTFACLEWCMIVDVGKGVCFYGPLPFIVSYSIKVDHPTSYSMETLTQNNIMGELNHQFPL